MSVGDASRTTETRVTCGFCGKEFTEDRGQPACQACPLSHACHFVRCPHCGYENPVRPGWLDRIGSWIKDHAST